MGRAGSLFAWTFDAELSRYAYDVSGGDIHVRDFRTGDEVARLGVAGRRVARARLSPNGRLLAAIFAADRSFESRLIIWNVDQRSTLLDLPSSNLIELAFRGDGKELAAARGDGAVAILSIDHPNQIRWLKGEAGVESIDYDPSGRRLAISLPSSRRLVVRKTSDGETVAEFPGFGRNGCVAWSPDGRYLIANARASAGSGIGVLDTRNPMKSPRTIRNDQLGSPTFAFLPQGDRFVSHGMDGSICLWQFADGQILASCRPPETAGPGGMALSRDGKTLAVASLTAALSPQPNVWLDRGESKSSARFMEKALDFSPDGRLLAVGNGEGLHLLCAETASIVAQIPIGGTASVAFLGDGSSLLTASDDGVLPEWSLNPTDGDGTLALSPRRDCRLPNVARFSVAHQAGLLAMQDRATSKFSVGALDSGQKDLDGSQHGTYRAAMSPRGNLVATTPSPSAKDGRVRVWDVRSGACIREISSVGGRSAEFSPDGRSLCISNAQGCFLWDVATWKQSLAIEHAAPDVMPGAVAFSPDGSLLAIAHNARSVRIHDSASGRELATLDDPEAALVVELEFDRQGRRLAASRLDRTVQIWDPAIRN